jgi:hypothetical protein
MDRDIELKLTAEEVNFVFATLNELPTKSNAWPLVMKIKKQAEGQMAVAESSPGKTQ